MYDKDFYGKVFDLLVREGHICSYSRIQYDKQAFVSYFTDNDRWSNKEWRFQGEFGFGGKLYRNSLNQHVIGYYSEDRTAKRDRLANKLNRLIVELEALHSGDEP